MKTETKEKIGAIGFSVAVLSTICWFAALMAYFFKGNAILALQFFSVSVLLYIVCYLIYKYWFSINKPFQLSIALQGISCIFIVGAIPIVIFEHKGFGIIFIVSFVIGVLYCYIYLNFFKKLAIKNGW